MLNGVSTRSTLEANVTLTWPDEHVCWQGVIEADPDYSVPFGVHLFVFQTRAHLRAACQDGQASAHSMTYPEADGAGIGATIMFSREELHLSLAAHEVTHVALFHAGRSETTRVGAKRWLKDHPESVAEMVGNLTALVWAAIEANVKE